MIHIFNLSLTAEQISIFTVQYNLVETKLNYVSKHIPALAIGTAFMGKSQKEQIPPSYYKVLTSTQN